jgi:hypothetical protein
MQVHERAAWEAFDLMAGMARSENSYSAYRNQAQELMRNIFKAVKENNEGRVKDLFATVVEELFTNFRGQCQNMYGLLPLDEMDLLKLTDGHKATSFDSWKQQMGPFSDFQPYYSEYFARLEVNQTIFSSRFFFFCAQIRM